MNNEINLLIVSELLSETPKTLQLVLDDREKKGEKTGKLNKPISILFTGSNQYTRSDFKKKEEGLAVLHEGISQI